MSHATVKSMKVSQTFTHYVFIHALPGSWKGTRAKLYSGLFGLLSDVSKIFDAPSITWTKSSYMDPVTSKTNAKVDAPSGMSSFAVSCAAEHAADSASDSHTNLVPISGPTVFSRKVLEKISLANLRENLELEAETSGSQKVLESTWRVYKEHIRQINEFLAGAAASVRPGVAASQLSVSPNSEVPAAATVPVQC